MNNALTIFNYGAAAVRTVEIDGEPWFVAKDVCAVLGVNTNNVRRDLDDDEVDSFKLNASGMAALIVNEPGLYALIQKSRKEEARTFKRWINHEVLPTIRKTGGLYMTDQKAEELLADPDLIIGLAMQVKELKQKTSMLTEKNAVMGQALAVAAPKVAYVDDMVDNCEGLISLGQFGKMLKQNKGMNTGRNKIFAQLRALGVIMKNHQVPMDRYMGRGLFVVKESHFNERTVQTTYLTTKGETWVHNLLSNSTL